MTSSPYTYLTTHLLKYCTEEGPVIFGTFSYPNQPGTIIYD